eukprot:2106533-Rhodomonas_salina.1
MAVLPFPLALASALPLAICDLRFAICDLRFAICDLRFAIRVEKDLSLGSLTRMAELFCWHSDARVRSAADATMRFLET